MCHNPYFSRWFSAIYTKGDNKMYNKSHNPYFSRWFSAIMMTIGIIKLALSHNPYFSRWFSAICTDGFSKPAPCQSQSLF